MEGIPTSCIEQYAKVSNISVLELYSQLFGGVSIGLDFTNDNNTYVFSNNKYHTVKSLYEGQTGITRTYKFVRNKMVKLLLIDVNHTLLFDYI